MQLFEDLIKCKDCMNNMNNGCILFTGKDVNEEDNKEVVKEENGLLKGLKDNLISILILVAVGIATIIVIFLRKQKNYDNIDKE